MKTVRLFVCGILAWFGWVAMLSAQVAYVDIADTQAHDKGNYHGIFDELPLTAITPQGWLQTYLEDQRDGLTGHLEKAGFPFASNMWAGESIQNAIKKGDWAAYEQTAFYLDGLLRVGLLLRDETLIKKAQEQLDYVLNHAADNGYLGPKHVQSRWPRAVFFRFMRAYYNATGDERVLAALAKHFQADKDFVDTEEFGRSSVTIETLGWLYQRTGNRDFVDQALRAKAFFDKNSAGNACTTETLLSDQQPHVHGAMFTEMVHLPAILYLYTGEKRWLEASVNGYRKIDRDHMLVDGIISSEEGTNGKGALAAHECCAIVDYAYNTGYLLMTTGEVSWADRIERACLNAGTSIVTNRYRAHQYFSAPNQLRATAYSSHLEAPVETDDTLTHFERSRLRYRPGHNVPCCTGSIHRLMPSYIGRMWLSDRQGGLVAALYGPSKVKALVGPEKQPVTIEEQTEFPFSGQVDFTIRTDKKVTFPLWLRIPAWADTARITVNNQPVVLKADAGTFVKLQREFAPDDRVRLVLGMKLKMTHWPRNGVALERGPLVYTLKIAEDRKAVPYEQFETENPTCDPNFPQFDIEPKSPWNYALAVDEARLQESIKVFLLPIAARPWEADVAPIQLKVPAKRVKNWDFNRQPAEKVRRWAVKHLETDRPAEFLFTPDLPDSPDCAPETEIVNFIPYGCSKIRMTILPYCAAN